MAYDYKSRKKEIYEILNSTTGVSNKDNISEIESETNGSLTFSNGIRGWVTAIFVDIVNSTELFQGENDKTIAKVIRTFSSETIQILNDTQMYKRIGIRGDSVFGIFVTPKQDDIVEVYNMAVEINTLKKMINKILIQNHFPQINYGIGIGASEDLVIKVGKKKVVNDLVFIGKAVVNAANLSSEAAREGIGPIAIDPVVFNNIEEIETKNNPEFPSFFDPEYEVLSSWNNLQSVSFYHGNIVRVDFNEWISGGMKND